jgi:hypothetical protein
MNFPMNDKPNLSEILHRDTLIYYVGSLVFAAGVALLAIGAAIVMICRIHYRSEPEKIFLSAIFMGAGVIMILTGINMIMKQTKYGYQIVTLSACMSFVGLLIFSLNYPEKWFYPLINNVVALYVGGFLTLLGNAFANVVLWMIHSKEEPVALERKKWKSKEYTDDEIERDIEDATRKSIEATAAEIKFKVGDGAGNIRVGKAFHKKRGDITRVKDDINEAKSLLKTINPQEKERSGSAEIDSISLQLSEAMKQQPVDKGRLGVLKEDIEYKFERIIGLVK